MSRFDCTFNIINLNEMLEKKLCTGMGLYILFLFLLHHLTGNQKRRAICRFSKKMFAVFGSVYVHQPTLTIIWNVHNAM